MADHKSVDKASELQIPKSIIANPKSINPGEQKM